VLPRHSYPPWDPESRRTRTQGTAEPDGGGNLRRSILLGAVPALPLLIIGLSREYWGVIYPLWGASFAVLGCTSLALLLRRIADRRGATPPTWQIFVWQFAAWVVSALILCAINLTPLCLGQANGDGSNNLAICLLLVPIWFASMSVLVIPLIYASSVAARAAMVRHTESRSLDANDGR